MKTAFDPNIATFDDGVKRVQKALEKAKTKVGDKIITSQDKDAITLVNLLAVDNVPQGFKKWQLPFVMEKSQLFISVASPDVEVPEHSHDEGDGIRFIVGGSVYYDGKELKQGDWMYIPRGSKYSITVGPLGAIMCYCYCCCCAGKGLSQRDWVINPQPFKVR